MATRKPRPAPPDVSESDVMPSEHAPVLNTQAELIDEICAELDAELVQTAGHVALLFRANPKPKAELSNLLRHQDLML